MAKSSETNPYLIAYHATDLREQPVESRDPRNAEVIASKYKEALKIIFDAHVAGAIQPPLSENLGIELAELYDDYYSSEDTTEPVTVLSFDEYLVSGMLVQTHKDMFRRIVEHGLSTLSEVSGDADG